MGAQIFYYLFGTTGRLAITVLVIAAVIAAIFPEAFDGLTERLARLVGLIVFLAVALYLLKRAWGWFWGGGRRRRRR